MSRLDCRDRSQTGCITFMTKHILYLEDLHVGQRFTGATRYAMDEKRMKEFAAEFDPQGFHLTEEAGARSIFKGLAASGWHTAAATMRLLIDSELALSEGTVGVGGEINWPRPTRAGDVLRIESEVLEITPSRSKPMQGMAKIRTTTLNQKDEVVQVFTASVLVYRRDADRSSQ
jgi:acyl dehydratase